MSMVVCFAFSNLYENLFRVWLHQDEKFFPSTVAFHLKNVNMKASKLRIKIECKIILFNFGMKLANSEDAIATISEI